MPFQRPTLTEHRNTILKDMQSSNLPGVSNITRFSVLGVFAKTWAGMAHLHDSFLDWIARQGVPWTATDENLEGWANLKGIIRKPASHASGFITFQGVSGASIPVKTALSIGGEGTAFTTNAATVGDNGSITLPATFATAGASGNLPINTTVSLINPIVGIQSSGYISKAFSGGADIEDDDSFRNRTLEAYQTGGKNGRADDYIEWALSVPGVTRAWVNPNGFGLGSVVVYVMFDNTNPSSNGLPNGSDGAAAYETRAGTATGDQLTVANALYDLRPVTALVIVCAPKPQPVDFVISRLGQANTAQNQNAIIASLRDVFRRYNKPGGTMYPSAWNAALDALNIPQYSVQSPSGPIAGDTVGSLPVLGTVHFES